MPRLLVALLLASLCACGPGLRRTFDDAGTPAEDGGTHTPPDAGTGSDAGADDAGTGGGVDGGADGGTAACTLDEECPAPSDSQPRCLQGTCSFVCNAPLIPCGQACCSAVAVTAGYEHSCVLTSGGTVRCWGSWMAIGGFEDKLRPVEIANLSDVKAISAGYADTCALTGTGGLMCWGQNINGMHGVGVTSPSSKPRDVSGLTEGVDAFAVGMYHACAVSDGGLQCWGGNNFGQLGDNSKNARYLPGPVSGLHTGVVGAAAGASHTCAWLVDGGAECWGSNLAGQLGDGTSGNERHVPGPVVGLDAGVDAMALGWTHTCALTSSGAVKCWGGNGEGQSGDGTTNGVRRTQVDVVGLDGGVLQVAVGNTSWHSCAALDGGAQCWGKNDKGQLGDTTVVGKRTPVEVFGLGPVQSIAPGGSHTCAVTAAGEVKCWGLNDKGQLGDGTRTDRWSPVDVQW